MALLDDLAAHPAGEPLDLRERFNHPLPMQVICELFGFPEGDKRAELARLVTAIMDTTATPEQADATGAAVYALLADLVGSKRENPADDLTSLLVTARDDEGRQMTEKELLDTLLLVIGAGHETTVDLLGNAVHALLTHPEQLALVRSGEVSWNDVIEETLRWAPSIAALPLRFAVEDIEIADGPTIRKGEAILPGTRRPAGMPRSMATPPPTSTSGAPTRSTWRSATASTTASAPRWPVWRPGSPSRPSSPRFPDLQLATAAEELEPTGGFISGGLRSLPVRLTPA